MRWTLGSDDGRERTRRRRRKDAGNFPSDWLFGHAPKQGISFGLSSLTLNNLVLYVRSLEAYREVWGTMMPP